MLAVKKGIYDFDSPEWEQVSGKAKNLIRNMICPREKRFNTQQVLNHSWFHTINSKPLPPINMKRLKAYVESN
jgi:calcium-dependent protein kinase